MFSGLDILTTSAASLSSPHEYPVFKYFRQEFNHFFCNDVDYLFLIQLGIIWIDVEVSNDAN